MSTFSNAGLNHDEARTDEQKELMAQIEKDGVCPFCAEHFRKYHPKPIIKENDSWFLTTNMSPYEGTKHHFLLVFKTSHIRTPAELSAQDSAELFEMVAWVTQEYNIPGATLIMRFGDGSYNGSSVEHLHAHIIAGEQKTEDTQSLKITVGYKKK